MSAYSNLQLITAANVVRLTTLSRMTIWRRVKIGSFPTPIKISQGRVAWRAADIEAWIENNRQGVPK